MSSSAKFLRAAGPYLGLGVLVWLGTTASTDVAFNLYRVSSPTLANQAENIFGQFFAAAFLVAVIGFILAAIWAMRPVHQRRHAKWFLAGAIVSIVLTALLMLVSIGFSRIDCADNCVWYVLPDWVSFALLLLAAGLWTTLTLLMYRWMLRNSAS